MGCAYQDTVNLDSRDVKCVKFEDKENSTKVIHASRTPHIPSRKSPRSFHPIAPKPMPWEETEDSEEEEETDFEDEDEEKEKGKGNVKEEEKGRESDKVEVAPNVSLGNPKKKQADQALL